MNAPTPADVPGQGEVDAEHLWIADLRKHPMGEVRLYVRGELRSGALAGGVTASIDEVVTATAYRALRLAAWDLDQQGLYEVAAWLRDRAASIATEPRA